LQDDEETRWYRLFKRPLSNSNILLGFDEGFLLFNTNQLNHMNKEQLESVIERKTEQLSREVVIISPEDNLPFDIQAEWLTQLLSTMYVEHGITKRRDSLLQDIARGNCRLWFAVKGEKPIGSAALVKQSDGSVEVGRAVSLENGAGGLLMLLAAQHHMMNAESPLVAEVRISDGFGGVPSGEATQVVCFRHLGLIPQATVPAFNHGNPNRQEMFIFSSSKLIPSGLPAFFPDDMAGFNLLTEIAVPMSKESFDEGLEIKQGRSSRLTNWTLAEKQPFSVILPDKSGVKFELVVKEAEKYSQFTLIPMSANPNNTMAILESLDMGFIPCGFDRNRDKDGFPVILLGKLKKGTLLAPIKIVSGVLDPSVVKAIQNIDQKFRNA